MKMACIVLTSSTVMMREIGTMFWKTIRQALLNSMTKVKAQDVSAQAKSLYNNRKRAYPKVTTALRTLFFAGLMPFS